MMAGDERDSAAEDREPTEAFPVTGGGDSEPTGARGVTGGGHREPSGGHGVTGGDDTATDPQDLVTAGEDRPGLERRSRVLLRAYPAAYRRERGEEIVGTLLEATPEGRTWPLSRDVRALAVGGLKARAALNRQRTVGANLRVAVMAGLATYLSFWIATCLVGVVKWFVPNSLYPYGWTSWPAVVYALLAGATVVLAWTAPRVWVVAGALAASATMITLALTNSGWLGPPLVQVLSLAGLAALAPGAGHPSRHWLWLPSVIAVMLPLWELGVGYSWLGYSWGFLSPGLPQLIIVAGAILWIGIDARLIVAVLTYVAVSGLQVPAEEISSGFSALASLFLLVVAVLAAPAVWLLWRQSAHKVG